MKNLVVSLGAGLAAATLACGALAPTPLADPSCSVESLIVDAENASEQLLLYENRNGYMYTFVDENGSKVTPGPNKFFVDGRGAHGSLSALHFHGELTTGEAYAGVGFTFLEPETGYDASKYSGISFVAKRGPESTDLVKVKLPDINTDPDGGVCKDCYNDFGIQFQVSEEWTRYTVNFTDLKQDSGWGDPQPESVDPTQLFGMQWQVEESGKKFDIWIDDVAFIGCGG